MMADDEQPLLAPTERQPLVGKHTKSRRALALGALFGASLLLGAAVSARAVPAASGPTALHAQFSPKTKELTRVDGPVAEGNYARKRRELEDGIKKAFRIVHGREVTSDELDAIVREGVVTSHPELVEANLDLENMAEG